MLFYRIFLTIAEFYKGRNLIAQIIAVFFSVAIVMLGLDWKYYEFGASLIPWHILIRPALALGTAVPVFLPLALLLYGTVLKDARLKNTAWGLGQSAMLGLAVSSFYKIWTGRIPPRLLHQAATINLIDYSHGFQFGFLRGGVFWGWPSSHATIAFAMAGALAMLYPERRVMKYLGFLYAAYVAFSVSVSIHWLSEAVAGAIIGTVIGLAVGRSFKKHEAHLMDPTT